MLSKDQKCHLLKTQIYLCYHIQYQRVVAILRKSPLGNNRTSISPNPTEKQYDSEQSTHNMTM